MFIKYAVLSLLTLVLWGCDPNHTKRCAWYLVPEKDYQSQADPGWVAVCARNYERNKQDCRLQAQLNFVKSIYGIKFKYVDLVYEEQEGRFPRRVKDIKRCL